MELVTIFLAGALASTPLYMTRLTLMGVPFYLPELFIIAGALCWLTLVIRGQLQVSWPKLTVLLPVLVFVLGALISTVSAGSVAFGGLKSWVFFPALFGFLTIQLVAKSSKARPILEKSLLVTAVVVALVGIGQEFWHLTRLSSFFNSPNAAAMWLVPVFFLVLPGRRSWFERLGLLVIVVAIGLTKSFGGLSALAIGLAVYWFVGRLQTTRQEKILTGSLAGALGVFSLVSLTPILTNWASQLFGVRLGGRAQIWTIARTAVHDHILTGIGPGVFQSYYGARIGLAFANPIEWSVPEPHNFYLATWLSSGLLGFVGLIWLIGALFYEQIKTRQPALVGALVVIIVHGLVDTPYWKNDLSIIFFLIVALSAFQPLPKST
ncbi:MAG TPA: O-antigen ligase family protein [Candidatus Saccharimonadales bacterium]|nr:O-antigen ligase family protein [Candidatus Saccharimonadales bacterium]